MKRRIVLSSIVVLVTCLVSVFSLGIFQSVMNLRDRGEASTTGGYSADGKVFNINDRTDFGVFINKAKTDSFSGVTVKLNDNIDMKGDNIAPIGVSYKIDSEKIILTDYREFDGVFDGNGYTISNLKIRADGCKYEDCAIGLFGVVTGSICNLQVKNITLQDYDAEFVDFYIGTLCGIFSGSLYGISNCIITDCRYYDYNVDLAITNNVYIAPVVGFVRSRYHVIIKNILIDGFDIEDKISDGKLPPVRGAHLIGPAFVTIGGGGITISDCVIKRCGISEDVIDTESNIFDGLDKMTGIVTTEGYAGMTDVSSDGGYDGTAWYYNSLYNGGWPMLRCFIPGWSTYKFKIDDGCKTKGYLSPGTDVTVPSNVVASLSNWVLFGDGVNGYIGCQAIPNNGQAFMRWDKSGNTYTAYFSLAGYWISFTNTGCNYPFKILCDCNCYMVDNWGYEYKIYIPEGTRIYTEYKCSSEDGYYSLYSFYINGKPHQVVYQVPIGYVATNYGYKYKAWESGMDNYDAEVNLNKGDTVIVDKEMTFSPTFAERTFTLTVNHGSNISRSYTDLNPSDEIQKTTTTSQIIINNIPAGTKLDIGDIGNTYLDFIMTGVYSISYWASFEGYVFDYATYYNTTIAMSEDLTININVSYRGIEEYYFDCDAGGEDFYYEPLMSTDGGNTFDSRFTQQFDVIIKSYTAIHVDYESENGYYTKITVSWRQEAREYLGAIDYVVVYDVEDAREQLGCGVEFIDIRFNNLTAGLPKYPNGSSKWSSVYVECRTSLAITFPTVSECYLYECYQDDSGAWTDDSSYIESTNNDILNTSNYSTSPIVKTIPTYELESIDLMTETITSRGFNRVRYYVNCNYPDGSSIRKEMVTYLCKYTASSSYFETMYNLSLSIETLIPGIWVSCIGDMEFVNSHNEVTAQYQFKPQDVVEEIAEVSVDNSLVMFMGKACEIQSSGVLIYEMTESTISTNEDLTEVTFDLNCEVTTYGSVDYAGFVYSYRPGNHKVTYSIKEEYMDSWRFVEKSYSDIGSVYFYVEAGLKHDVPTTYDGYYIDLWVEQPIGYQVSFKNGFYAWSLGDGFEAYISATLYRGTDINDENKLDINNLTDTHVSYDSYSREYRITTTLDEWLDISGYCEIDNEENNNRYIFEFTVGSSDGSSEHYSLVYDFSRHDNNKLYTLKFGFSTDWTVSDWQQLSSDGEPLWTSWNRYNLVVSYTGRTYEIGK